MITRTATRGRRLMAALMTVAVMFALSPFTGTAQNQDKKEVTVKVENGKIIINGEEVSPDEDGRVVLKDENGEDFVVYVRKRGDRSTVMVDSGDEDGPRMFAFGRNGSGVWDVADDELEAGLERRFRFRRGDGEDGDGDVRVFLDAAPGMRADALELRALRERAPRMAESVRKMAQRAREMAENEAHLRHQFDLFRTDEPLMGMLLEHLNEDLRQLEDEIRKVARDARLAEESERAELEAKLDQMLDEAFDMKQTEARKTVQEMTERLEKLRQRENERAAARQQIIENRKKQLLGERGVLDW